jgi:hypothetical protein
MSREKPIADTATTHVTASILLKGKDRCGVSLDQLNREYIKEGWLS